MSWRLIVRPEAEADITDGALWYDEQRPGLGIAFTAAVRRAIRRAVENPRACRLMRRSPEVRRVRTPRFPYRVVFLLKDDLVSVFAVIHDKRHESTWIERLQKS